MGKDGQGIREGRSNSLAGSVVKILLSCMAGLSHLSTEGETVFSLFSEGCLARDLFSSYTKCCLVLPLRTFPIFPSRFWK